MPIKPENDPRNLAERQWLFAKCLGLLISYAYDHGCKLTVGDSYRDPAYHPLARVASGALSAHAQKLAADLNLFVNDVYITGPHPMWQALGSFWQNLDPLCRWGGDWNGDGQTERGEDDLNHFSIIYHGVE